MWRLNTSGALDTSFATNGVYTDTANTFSRLTARSVPAQPKPWPTLADAIKGQRLFPLEQISGTMVGVYSPPSAPGLSPTGWHFHFLSKDRTRGGHVLAVSIAQAQARADNIERVTVEFPAHPLPRQGVAGPAAGTE
jgi:acetolactate decarboxylase